MTGPSSGERRETPNSVGYLRKSEPQSVVRLQLREGRHLLCWVLGKSEPQSLVNLQVRGGRHLLCWVLGKSEPQSVISPVTEASCF
jgi:hypothetical protein